MPIRMTGMASGLDTDAIVQELMSAQSMKKQKIVNKQTKLTWTQEIWSDLNKKLYSFYTGSLSTLKTQGSYKTKKVSSSNESVATATAGINAAIGAHSLAVKQLASAQYVTGSKVELKDANGNVTKAGTKTTLKDLGMTVGTVIQIKNGDQEENLTIDESTTINDFVNKCKKAGLTASFDTAQQRFFISSSKSGKENSFSITTGVSVSAGADAEIKNLISNATTDDAIYEEYVNAADMIKEQLTKKAEEAGGTLTDAAIEFMEIVRNTDADNKDEVLSKYDITEEQFNDFVDAYNKAGDMEASLTPSMTAYLNGTKNKSELSNDFNKVAEENDNIVFKSELKVAFNNIKGVSAASFEDLQYLDITGNTSYTDDQLESIGVTREQYENYAFLANNIGDKNKLDEQLQKYFQKDMLTGSKISEAVEKVGEPISDVFTKLENVDISAGTEYTDEELEEIGVTREQYEGYEFLVNTVGIKRDATADEIQAQIQNIQNSVNDTSQLDQLGLGTNVTKRAAQDAVIVLDGAELTGASNEFTVNGLTLNLTSTTEKKDGSGGYDEIQLNVTNNVDDIYEMVKTFVKDYNDILKELNEKYNAKSSKGYDPLTDEQKEAMTDKEVEKWETKIKDSLLRRDGTINSITAAMRQSMMATAKVNGKTYSLSSLGIKTSSDYTEGGLLHIMGDEDDDTYKSEKNKLKAMLEEDPEVVMEVLTTAAKELYTKYTEKMSRTSLSSALTFYNDIKMKDQQREYTKEISKWNTKLQDMEDRYYKQFTAMEKAMSQLQSQSNYFSSFFGGGN